jgi:two-component system, LuxR family, sensor kinase FixL
MSARMGTAPQREPAPPPAGPSGVGHYRAVRQRSPFVQRMRMRVAVGLAVSLAVSVLVTTLIAVVQGRWTVVMVGAVAGAISTWMTLRIRRTRAVKAPVAVFVTWMFAIMGVAFCADQGLSLSFTAWPAVMALLALYMLGPRPGLIFLGVALVEVGIALAVYRAGATFDMGLAPWDSGTRVVVAFTGVGLTGVLGYLYESAQQRTQAELEDALATSERNEHQLDALVESATAAICSFDRRLRLQVHNRAFETMVGARGARAPSPNDAVSEILDPGQWARWRPHVERVLAGAGAISFEEAPPPGQDGPDYETMLQPIVAHGEITGVTAFCRDISARKRAEAEMSRLNQELVRMSRQAGMATVAGEVLHNAGNVLNSTGVSVSMIERHVKNLRTGHLTRLAALVDEHTGALEAFLREDPRGQRVPELLRALAEHFEQQQAQLGAEVTALQGSIEHFIRVIHAQQNHARGLGIIETVAVAELIDAVLDLQTASGSQIGITVEREIGELPLLHIDKHKAIEILVNLVSNARHSLRDSGRPDKRLRIRAEAVTRARARTADGAATDASGMAGERLRIHVEDNGLGISSEHREKLFRLGFTTKHDGSGIGLHSSANAAQQLGGSLSFHSDGPGQGATFTLELPVAPAAEPDVHEAS